MKKIGISIIGGTGFGAGELLRLLISHPEVEVSSVVSNSKAGERISSIHPHLAGFYDFNFSQKVDFEKLSSYEKPVIITALPHSVSSGFIVDALLGIEKYNISVIDLSGDFRLKDAKLREAFYANTPEIEKVSKNFVFGLPEINRKEIKGSRFISNPGCFALTSILALTPLAQFGIKANVAIDGKSGTSGGGRSLNQAFHHPTSNSNAFAYKVLAHRHEVEISEALGEHCFELSFVPHVIPASRGIYITAHAFLDNKISDKDIFKAYRDFYSDSPFVRLRSKPPQLYQVVGSNFCDIFITVRNKTVVVNAASDNLIKGMCGTAIQNLNLISGLEETTGLVKAGMGPV